MKKNAISNFFISCVNNIFLYIQNLNYKNDLINVYLKNLDNILTITFISCVNKILPYNYNYIHKNGILNNISFPKSYPWKHIIFIVIITDNIQYALRKLSGIIVNNCLILVTGHKVN